MWKVYDWISIPNGTEVPGDPLMPPTKWWNHLWLLLFRWRMTTIFRVANVPPEGYHIGYIPMEGKPMYQTRPYCRISFRVRNGHEPCTFFAVNQRGEEIPLKFVAQADIKEERFKGVPLI